MKRVFMIVAICIAANAQGSIDTVKVTSEIREVTVFFSGAQVSRNARLTLNQGKYVVLFDHLPNEINSRSIQVKGVDNCNILSVKHELIFPSESRRNKDEADLRNSIELQEAKMKAIRNKMEVFDLEEAILVDNSRMGSKDGGVSVAELQEAAEFYRKRVNEIRQGKLDLSREMDAAEKTLLEIYSRLNELTVLRRKSYSQVLVTIECTREVKSTLTLSYYVSSAGWTPTYDFRVDDISQPLNVVYNARVFQSSGENWKNVKVKLSANNPSLDGDKPQLLTWIAGTDPYKKQPVKQESGTLSGKVLDADTREPLPFVTLQVERRGDYIAAATTDFDGRFTIKPLVPGMYDVKLSYIGYNQTKFEGVVIESQKIANKDFLLKANDIKLSEVQVVNYSIPVLSRHSTVTRTDINRLPGRSAENLSVRTGGVPAASISEVQIGVRGARSEYYIDGLKVMGSNSLNLFSNSLKNNVTNVEYSIDVPHNIPSDGQDHILKIKDVNVPVNYVYHVVPKLDRDAFLTAEVANWDQLNLLSGRSAIYYQGTFTGESYIDAEQTADTLRISLGRDKGIVVQREGNREMYDKRLSGGNIRETMGWTISVRNSKSTLVKIVIEDQIPVSDRKSVEISLLEQSGAKFNSDTGILTWETEIDSAGRKVLNYRFAVRYPRYGGVDF